MKKRAFFKEPVDLSKFCPSIARHKLRVSNYVQVRRNYGRQPSNQLRGARGSLAHACSTGLSTGCRLMPMTARCGATAPCSGATTVRVAAHETSGGKVMTVWIAQSVCSCRRMRNSWQSRPRHVQQCVPHNQPTPCMRCSIRSTQSAAGSSGATVCSISLHLLVSISLHLLV